MAFCHQRGQNRQEQYQQAKAGKVARLLLSAWTCIEEIQKFLKSTDFKLVETEAGPSEVRESIGTLPVRAVCIQPKLSCPTNILAWTASASTYLCLALSVASAFASRRERRDWMGQGDVNMQLERTVGDKQASPLYHALSAIPRPSVWR